MYGTQVNKFSDMEKPKISEHPGKTHYPTVRSMIPRKRIKALFLRNRDRHEIPTKSEENAEKQYLAERTPRFSHGKNKNSRDFRYTNRIRTRIVPLFFSWLEENRDTLNAKNARKLPNRSRKYSELYTKHAETRTWHLSDWRGSRAYPTTVYHSPPPKEIFSEQLSRIRWTCRTRAAHFPKIIYIHEIPVRPENVCILLMILKYETI